MLAAAALARLYERGWEIKVFGSHAPGDMKFRDDLMKAMIRDWCVEVGTNQRDFRVTYANTHDEPVGSLMTILLTKDRQPYRLTELNLGRSLVIDIGGFTTDWIAG